MRVVTWSGHDVVGFRSGADELDDWLMRRAAAAHALGDAVIRVACTTNDRVVGFHALCAASIERSLVPGALRRNAPDPIPVLLLARLAVDIEAQGVGVGAALVGDVVRRTVAASEVVGFRALVIHCRDSNARAFYDKLLPIKQLPSSPLHVFVPIHALRP